MDGANQVTKPVVNLILDSGAFSAFTKGVPIDIDKYADFAKRNINNVSAVVNLDSIQPGNPLAGAEEGLKNFRYLRDKHNILSMPVFHGSEPIRYLYTMLEEVKYIGLAVRSGAKSESKVFAWYDEVWPLITDNDGFPMNRFHAFGDTSARSLLQYPWYSADSSSWIQHASRTGCVLMNGALMQFNARTASSAKRILDDRQPWQEEFVKVGLDPDKCIDPTVPVGALRLIRSYYNVCYFLQLETKAIKTDRYTGPAPIESRRYPTGGTRRVDPLKVHFVLESDAPSDNLAVLGSLSITNVLLSYFYITEKNWNDVIIPFLYDPRKACVENKKIAAKVETLNKYLLNPTIV